VRKAEKNHELSEDEAHDIQEKIQKLTDKYVTKVDELLKAKEEDIATV